MVLRGVGESALSPTPTSGSSRASTVHGAAGIALTMRHLGHAPLTLWSAEEILRRLPGCRRHRVCANLAP